MLCGGFGPESHTVLRFGAVATIVFAISPAVVVVGATKGVAKGLVQSSIISITPAWEALGSKDGGPCGQPSAPRSSLQSGMQTQNILRGGSSQLYRQAPQH